MQQREEERRALHDKLQANQEEIVQVQQEVSTSVDKQKDPFALRQYIAMVMEAEKARTENSHPMLYLSHVQHTCGLCPVGVGVVNNFVHHHQLSL